MRPVRRQEILSISNRRLRSSRNEGQFRLIVVTEHIESEIAIKPELFGSKLFSSL